MENKKRKRPGITVGSSLILVTFVLLCLVAFAALSFVSANADYGLSKQTATKTGHYYEAVGNAEKQLAAIDKQLKELAANADSEEAFMASILQTYPEDAVVTASEAGTNIILAFTTAIDDHSDISITLKAKSLRQCVDAKDYCYEIQTYKTVTTSKPDTQTISGDGGLIFD